MHANAHVYCRINTSAHILLPSNSTATLVLYIQSFYNICCCRTVYVLTLLLFLVLFWQIYLNTNHFLSYMHSQDMQLQMNVCVWIHWHSLKLIFQHDNIKFWYWSPARGIKTIILTNCFETSAEKTSPETFRSRLYNVLVQKWIYFNKSENRNHISVKKRCEYFQFDSNKQEHGDRPAL